MCTHEQVIAIPMEEYKTMLREIERSRVVLRSVLAYLHACQFGDIRRPEIMSIIEAGGPYE